MFTKVTFGISRKSKLFSKMVLISRNFEYFHKPRISLQGPRVSLRLGGSPWGLEGSPWGLGGSFLVYGNTQNFAKLRLVKKRRLLPKAFMLSFYVAGDEGISG